MSRMPNLMSYSSENIAGISLTGHFYIRISITIYDRMK